MADRNKIIDGIKKGGSLAIYLGTASLMKPVITSGNENRSAVSKVCAVGTGAVISCGISSYASKFFGKMVDSIVEFIDDVKPKKDKEVTTNGATKQ